MVQAAFLWIARPEFEYANDQRNIKQIEDGPPTAAKVIQRMLMPVAMKKSNRSLKPIARGRGEPVCISSIVLL